MTRTISEMRNLGPQMELMLAEIEIFDEDDLREIGSTNAWQRLRFVFSNRISLTALYAALQDRRWQEVTGEEKSRLKHTVGR